VENVTDRVSNPFGMRPPCERYVPGYGDANADFHVVGDHPGTYGGEHTEVPFTNDTGLRLQDALAAAGLLENVGERPETNRTFLSYLHMCVPSGGDGTEEPTDAEYGSMERFFDAELRAIAAHVLLPVGERATRHVLATYTARYGKVSLDMRELHGSEVLGTGWLVYPIANPTSWETGDRERLVEALERLQAGDFRREVDLGRFGDGDEPYFVR
jgi:uracil-DNA glycosylase family 4